MISGKKKDRGAVDDVIARSEKQMLRLYSALQVWKAREISPRTEIRIFSNKVPFERNRVHHTQHLNLFLRFVF